MGPTRLPLYLLLFPLGLALLLAGALSREGTAYSQAMPTPDRLAQPTLPPQPSQADRGAQVYWLSCLPCHGDRGQGLTEEFRQTYPAEDRNCWTSGCHGPRPYEDGFTLPEEIPPLIGPGSLARFQNAAILRIYILATMPYWKPGSLPQDQTWQVTAFLLRENGLWDAREDLGASNAERVPVGPAADARVDEDSLPVIPAAAIALILFLLLRAARRRPA